MPRNPMPPDRDRARRKWESLRRMTVARGCSVHEADTAARLARALDARYGFSRDPSAARPDFDERFHRAEQRAAVRWRWEYRRCGKPRCWCMRQAATSRGHGPYKYAKRREGKTVRSIYIGR